MLYLAAVVSSAVLHIRSHREKQEDGDPGVVGHRPCKQEAQGLSEVRRPDCQAAAGGDGGNHAAQRLSQTVHNRITPLASSLPSPLHLSL